jgi:hypothetical protein
VVAVVFLQMASLFVATRTASACDCIGLKPLSAEVQREAPVIFVGTVLEITERNEHISTTYAGGAKTTVRPIERRVTFQVTQACGWEPAAGLTHREPRATSHEPPTSPVPQFPSCRQFVPVGLLPPLSVR